jgi:SAM-dependent methyltransferase
MLGYRHRILDLCELVMAGRGTAASALDFGSGDGWFAAAFVQRRIAAQIVPVDIHRWKRCYIEPILYSGRRLPFDDRAFDLVYSIDVIHHCPNPEASLRELLRCSKQYVLIKDHFYDTLKDWLLLCMLDEIGNRRRRVSSPYKYRRASEWAATMDEQGFVLERLVHPAHCHPSALRGMFSHLQFVGLWRREADKFVASPRAAGASSPEQ